MALEKFASFLAIELGEFKWLPKTCTGLLLRRCISDTFILYCAPCIN